ncbi:E3 ubiquitin-protein ligase ubr1, partial [Spiromyces aspiralis]
TLVREHRFLYSIIDVLCKFFPVPTPPPLLRNGIILCDTEPFRNRRYFHAFHDMRYLVATPVVSKWVANTHEFLMNYVNFIKLFQGMNPIRRAATEHIEFESDEWINAFNVTLQVAKSCRQYAECFVGNPRTTLLSVRTILRETYHDAMKLSEENFAWHILKLQEQNEGSFDDIIVPPHAVLTEPLKHNTKVATTIGGIRYTIIDYDVTTNPVSFHHPLHWFITQFLQHASTFDDNVAKRYGFESLQELVLSAIDPSYDVLLTGNVDESKDADRYNLPRFNLESAKMQLLTIFDYSVRVCALIAQIHVDFWIRNGRTLKIQGSHYQDVSLRENTYDQDVALIQFFFCIWDDQDQILLTLIDRFRLIEWMSDFPNLHRYVYDPAQTIRIVEEFLNLLIAIVGERHVLSGCEAMELANREVIHAAVEPLPFSVITKKIPERLALLPDFESVVHKHAVFKEPTIHSTTGKYEVKDEYLDEIDPYFVHYPRQEREKIKELLWKRLKDRAQQPGSKYTLPKLLVPKPLPIKTGMFTRLSLILHTPLACDFLFYSLANSAMFSHTPASDTIIDEALYLIMLALEDAKRPEVVEKLGVVDGIRGGLWHYSLKRVLPLQGTEGYNLVGVLVTLYSRQQLKAWWPQIEYILDTLREGGATLSQVIDEYLRLTKKDKSDPEEEIRRKKELAKQRQAQLLAELQNQQKNFMDQFGLDLDDTDDDLDGDADLDIMDDAGIAAAVATPTDGEHGNARGTASGGKATRVRKLLWDTGSETCITCQGACDSSAPFGLLGLVQPSRLIRHTPMQYADTVLKILTENPSLDTTVESCADNWPKGRYRERMTHGLTHAEIAHFSDIPADYVTGGEASGAHGSIGGFPSHYQSRGIYASTCNHMMHVSCFLQYYSAVEAAQQAQLTRNHPESLARLEF